MIKILHDFELIKHDLPQTEIMVIPVSDVHLGALEHCRKEWEGFCKFVMETPNCYITLGGDLVNNSIRTSVANPFDEVLRPREQKIRMVENLTPIRDRILCAVSGNHERRTTKDSDMDITYDIMAKLDLEHLYRENIAFVKLALGTRKTEDKSETSFVLGVTHGAGGGIFTGASVNRNERFGNIVEGLDVLVVGHTHKGAITKPSKIVVDSNHNKVSVKSYTVVSSIAWLNYGGYAAQKMLLPSQAALPQRLILGGNKNKKLIEVRW